MKRTIAVMLAVVMLLSLAACKGEVKNAEPVMLPTTTAPVSTVGETGAQNSEKASLGIRMQDADGKGVLVLELAPGGSAEKAGVQVGDIITKLGGQEVTCMDDLTTIVSGFSEHDSTTIEVERDGQRQTMVITFGSLLILPE